MSKVEFNNCFFGRIDRGILCRVYSRLGLPQPLVPVLVWPCSGTRAAVSPGSLSVVPCGSVPGTPRALLLSPSRAGACLGLCGCWGQEPQKGMLVTGLPRDAFPLGVVRVEVTLLPGGVHPCPCRRSRCCRREWESCSFLPLLGLGSPPSPSNNFSLYKLSLAHLQRQLCTLTCFFLTTVNYAGFLWQTYLTFLILFFLFSTALSKI